MAIRLPEPIRPEIAWAWDLFCSHWGIPYMLTEEGPELLISNEEHADIRVSDRFERIWREKQLKNREVFPEEPLLRCEDGTPDFLGTAFYMVNSLQEWGAGEKEVDSHGRFLFEASYQHRFDVVEEDLVTGLFEELLGSCRKKLGDPELHAPETSVFLTHDIDRIRKGNLREAAWKLKKGKWLGALRSLWKRARGFHEWENIEAMLKLHKDKGMKSSFFWVTERGTAPDGIRNADYDVGDPRYLRSMKKVKEAGFCNGLHKSSFQKGFEEEFQKLDHAERINRNHYLKFQLPHHYQALEEDGFLLDTSLGFREAIGFRNSYGRPFHPYDPKRRCKMRLLEVPLHIMDVTLVGHYREPFRRAVEFIQNCPSGTLITILWHNNHLTDGRFRDRKRLYEKLLEWFRTNGTPGITPDRILERAAPSSKEE